MSKTLISDLLTVNDYAAWSGGINWQGVDSAPGADPNGDGVTNFLAYALDVSPLGPVAAEDLPEPALDLAALDGPWLELRYRQNCSASDLEYTVQDSSDLIGWPDLTVDGVKVIEEVVDPDPDGDGSAMLRRVRLKIEPEESGRFLRLRVDALAAST